MNRILLAALAGVALVGLAPAAVQAQPAVCGSDYVNVRARASIGGEIVTRLKKGDSVFILEEITLKKPKADEPANWARISFPTNSHVWVDSQYLDVTNKIVRVKKLNVRSGPGENYGVVGTLTKDESVTSLRQKEGWWEVAAPTNAYAFVALDLLVKQPGETVPNATNAPAVAAVAPPTIPATPSPAVETPAPAPPTISTPANPVVVVTPPPTVPTPVAHDESATPTAPPAVESKPPVAPARPMLAQPKAAPKAAEPPRIITREGKVHRALDPNTPTGFVLENIDTGLDMDYLYTANPKINLKKYLGFHVIVTGTEGVDKHWPATPVLTVQSIEFP